MNLNDLLNHVADDADLGVMVDPGDIRRAGDLRTARSQRLRVRAVAAAVVLIASTGAVLLSRAGEDKTEPAPPVPPTQVSYLGDDGISVIAQDGTRETLPAKDVDRYAFSPDGQQVAYITYKTGTNWLWIADTDGARADRQPAPCAGCMPGYGLAWSNDGARLAYSVFTPGEHRPAQLRIRTLGTTQEQVYRMPRGCDARGPRFSPDDQTLAFNLSCEDGEYEAGEYVTTLDLDEGTSSLTRLTDAYSQVQLPSWDADGQTLYFTATTSGDNTNTTTGRGDLFAVSADGTGPRQITHAVAGERFFAATPYQGRFLINRARGEGKWKVGWLSGDGRTFTPMKGPDGKPIVGYQPQLQP